MANFLGYYYSHYGKFWMRLIGRERLTRLREVGGNVEKWALNWAAEVIAAHWKGASDVREQFPNAHDQGEGCFMFPVRDCDWAIAVRFAFPQGVALIMDLKARDDADGS